jgi:hypothetical protein
MMSTSDDQVARLNEENASRPRQIKNHVLVSALSSPSNTSKTNSPRQIHQRLVFSDPVAFRYLEEDPTTVVLERRRRLQGYEIYLVEQWACSRIHPTFIIATYTGDFSHSIMVSVLSVPKDESTWSARLKVYFKAMSEYHAREKQTSLGTLMVTNLSGFPSSLTVISVPDGDIRKHREDFIVNENLKRLGCAGRAGLNLQNPQPSTIAKFHHLYRTSETVPLYTSVMELIKLCQVSLSLYGKLAPAYADGLLCDVTEKAINNWWSDIGAYIYNIEPNDGILGPSTVSALVGLLMGAFNRLKTFGASLGKDVFDVTSTKRAIGQFQKSQRMERTRRLDRQTLMKLHKVTAKTASGEGWTVPKAVKSTVAELSGKGGEMVMGIVGGREKAGIAEVETLDMERLAQLVTGTKARWLWQGKVARSTEAETAGPFGPSGNDKIFSTDEQGNYMWTSKHRNSAWSDNPIRKPDHGDDPENRSGFGRFKDAVGLPGLRSHQARYSKEDVWTDATNVQEPHDRRDKRAPNPTPGNLTSEAHAREAFPSLQKSTSETPSFDPGLPIQHNVSQVSLQSGSALSQQASESLEADSERIAEDLDPIGQTRNEQLEKVKRKLSSDTYSRFFPDPENHNPRASGLKRTQSSTKVVNVGPENPRTNRVPRCLSFSAIEDVVLGWDDISTEESSRTTTTTSTATDAQPPHRTLLAEEAHTILALSKFSKLSYLERVTIPFTERQVSSIDALDRLTERTQSELNTLYYERLEDYQTHKATATDVMADESQGLSEGLRRVEMLGAKLDYELNALTSRVEEVENGVGEFERAVRGIEGRVGELVEEGERREGWWVYWRRFWWGTRAGLS